MNTPKARVAHEAVLTFSSTQNTEEAEKIAHETGVMLRFLGYLPGGEHCLTRVDSTSIHSGPPHLWSEALKIDASGDGMYKAIDDRLDAGYRVTSPLNESFYRSTSPPEVAA